MFTRKHRSRLLMTAMLAVAAATLVQTAGAQVIFNNPPCVNVTVTNNSLCNAQLTFNTLPPGAWPAGFIVPGGGGTFNLPVPVTGVNVTGITSMGGFVYGVNPPPPPPFTRCNPTDWWIPNVTLGPAPGCCFDICLDPTTCSITLWPSGALPPCRP